MVAELYDETDGHDLILYGMVHQVEITRVLPGNSIMVVPHNCPNGFFLYPEDINALYKYLERYVTE